jgi:amidophosphoribosyltransferase
LAPDIFEFVYFARPDSVIDGISVYRSRMAMGNALAQEVQRVLTEKQITVDVVIPVPDTSRVAALNLAQALGLPYREGIVKNRYIGRTFIMPDQQMRCVLHDHLFNSGQTLDSTSSRKKSVRKKLNAMALEFVDKNVLIVDGEVSTNIYTLPCDQWMFFFLSSQDSIVRGTTCREIIQMAKDVGAKKVIMASCAPPIRYPNVHGIDMPSRAELVAHGRTTEEVAEAIGADVVIFQTLPDLVSSVRQVNPAIERFECSVFSGEYITGGVDSEYLDHLENTRSDNMKTKAAAAGAAIVTSSGVNGHSAGTGASTGAPSKGGGNVTGSTVRSADDDRGGTSSDPATPSGHVDGVDDTIGLHNSWKLS